MPNFVLDTKKNLLQEAIALGLHDREQKQSLGIPCLNDWEVQAREQTLHIVGKVKFHSRYPDGSVIKTSSIVSHRRIGKRLVVMTNNSIYELGKPSKAQISHDNGEVNSLNPQHYIPLSDFLNSSSEVNDVTELR